MRRFLILIFISLKTAASSLAVVGTPVIVTTQWDTPHFNEPFMSLFTENSEKLMTGAGSGKIHRYDDYHGCTDLLKKMFEYPLSSMLDSKYISKEFYDFLMNSKTNLDARQVIFINHGEISNQLFPDGRSLMPNLIDIFRDDAKTMEELQGSLKSMAAHWINVDGSMWVVRGQVPEKSGVLNYGKRAMPWEDHAHFHDFFSNHHQGTLNWEFGRAHREPTTDFMNFMQMGAHVAAKDAISLGVPLNEGRIFIHAKNQKMADHVMKTYGFKTVSPHPPDDFLLMAHLDELIQHVGNAQKFYNQDMIKKFLPHATAAQLIKAEHDIRNAFFFHLDDLSSPRAGEGIFVYNGTYSNSISKAFLDADPHFYRRNNPGNFRMNFQEGGLMREGFGARLVYQPQSRNWGVSQLSEARFREDPHYLERIITELTQRNRKMIRSIHPEDPLEKPAAFRAFTMSTESKLISERAKALGAKVNTQVIKTDTRIDKVKNYAQYNADFKTFYLLEFSADDAKRITQDFSVSAPPASFKEGLKQINYEHVSSF